MTKKEKEELLEKAFIDKEQWDLYEVKEDGTIYPPSFDILYERGFITEDEYKAYLDYKEVDKTKICTMEDLQAENKKLWDTVEYLLKQTEAGIPKEEGKKEVKAIE